MPQRQPIPFPVAVRPASPAPPAAPDVRRAKLLRPRLLVDTVRRPALEARLEQAVDAPLTLVAAGAGFGKTTLVSAWVSRTRRTVAWLSLDAEDADLRRFLSHLLAALRTAAPGIAPAVDDLLGGSRPLEPETAAAVLADELLDLQDEVVLVLDDLHAVAGGEPVALLSELLRHPPPGLRVVATSRMDLADIGIEGSGALRTGAIRERDLRLDANEIAAVLGGGSALPVSEVAELTDGWAAGVRAMAVAGRRAAPERLRDYLRRDVLAGQPPELVRFLRDIAVLERASPSLAAAVAGAPLAPADAAALLARAERLGLFTTRLDDDGEWWMVHPLLREALGEEEGGRGEARSLGHARAAAWFAAAGMVEEAVAHALRAGDAAASADLVAGFVPAWLERGGDLPLRWIERLDPAETASRPALLVVRAHHLITLGNAPAALAALADAERRLGDAAAAADARAFASLAAGIACLRGLAANVGGDPRGLLDELGAAMGAGVPAASWQHSGIAGTWGFAMAMAGRADEAIPRLEAEALAGGGGAGLSPRLLVNVAGLHLRQGRLSEARRWLALLDAALGAAPDGFGAVWSCMIRAVADWMEGDLGAAEAAARRGLAGSPGQFLPAKRQLTDVLARTLLAEGRVEEAWIAAAEDRRRIELAGAARLLPGAEAIEAEIALAAGDRQAARRWADAAPIGHPPDALRATDHPAMARARIWLARGAAGDAARAAASLRELVDRQEAFHQGLLQVRTLPLLAAAQDAAGDRAAALATMRTALADAPATLAGRFADAGPRAGALLAALAGDPADPAAPAARATLAALAIEPGAEDAAPSPPPSPLTPRQAEILAMAAAGMTNKEIGAALGITEISARDHVKRILRKLGARDRHAAVEVARVAGWL